MADESVCIGSHQPTDSYLNIPAIMSAIELTKAEAVHPGYGFLSENANFAKILEENNIKFIGPSSKLIKMMGDKIEAKSSINWSHCNLEGQDISKINSFDFTESERPFDKNGVPYQFKQLPIGKGLSGWRLRTFGEFYRKFKGRLINVNWKAHASVFNRDIVNPPISFYSYHISGCERLANGNTLIAEGAPGRIFEVTRDKEIVWEYINPFTSEKGVDPSASPGIYPNAVVRAHRYSPDYPGLQGKDLDPDRFKALNALYS